MEWWPHMQRHVCPRLCGIDLMIEDECGKIIVTSRKIYENLQSEQTMAAGVHGALRDRTMAGAYTKQLSDALARLIYLRKSL